MFSFVVLLKTHIPQFEGKLTLQTWIHSKETRPFCCRFRRKCVPCRPHKLNVLFLSEFPFKDLIHAAASFLEEPVLALRGVDLQGTSCSDELLVQMKDWCYSISHVTSSHSCIDDLMVLFINIHFNFVCFHQVQSRVSAPSSS